MSFILDALRKSDARRQQSGAPGLNSPEPQQPPRRKRRRLLPWLAGSLVLLAVVSAAVYVLRPEWLPQDTGVVEPTRSTAEGDARPEAPSGSGAERPSEPARHEYDAAEAARRERAASRVATQRPPQPAAGEEAPEAGEESSGESATRDRRQPIAARPERIVRREAPQRESAPIPADEAAKELERRVAEEARSRRKTRDASAQPPDEPREQPAERRPEPREEQKPVSEPRPLNEGVAEYVRQWELPLSVRRNLPDLKLTIHVFSPVEAERFVLINGERYVPGDAIGEAQIVDISRDGAIVDFRSHRFLLEPR